MSIKPTGDIKLDASFEQLQENVTSILQVVEEQTKRIKFLKDLAGDRQARIEELEERLAIETKACRFGHTARIAELEALCVDTIHMDGIGSLDELRERITDLEAEVKRYAKERVPIARRIAELEAELNEANTTYNAAMRVQHQSFDIVEAERDRMAAVVEAARAYRNKAKPDDVKSYEYHAWQLDSNDLLTALAALDKGEA